MITTFNLFENIDIDNIFSYINKHVDMSIIEDWINNNKENIDIKNSDGWTPLLLASTYNDYDLIKLFIDNGANINERINFGDNALILYCIYNTNKKLNMKIIELFISNDINWDLINDNDMFLDKLLYYQSFMITKKYPDIEKFYHRLLGKRISKKKFNL